MRAVAAALMLSACVTIDAEDVLVAPLFDAQDTIVRVSGGTEEEMAFGTYLARYGGEAGTIGGSIFGHGGSGATIDDALERRGGKTASIKVKLTIAYELGEDPSVKRLSVAGQSGPIAALRGSFGEHKDTSGVIVHCGGVGSDLSSMGALTLLKVMPFGRAMVFDYPGYGQSEGARTFRDLDASATALARYLDTQKGPIILWGYSFGGLFCSALAERMAHPTAAIIETSAPDARSAVSFFAPWWARPFVRVSPEISEFDAARSLAAADIPVLVIGAGRDEVLSPKASLDLAARLRADGVATVYVEAPDAGHFGATNAGEVKTALRAFLARVRGEANEDAEPTIDASADVDQ